MTDPEEREEDDQIDLEDALAELSQTDGAVEDTEPDAGGSIRAHPDVDPVWAAALESMEEQKGLFQDIEDAAIKYILEQKKGGHDS